MLLIVHQGVSPKDKELKSDTARVKDLEISMGRVFEIDVVFLMFKHF